MSTRYIAVTTISKTVTPGERKTANSAGRRPVVKEIAPGTILVIDDKDEAKELTAIGAIRLATEDDLKPGLKSEGINDLSLEQQQMSAADYAELQRYRAAEDERRRAANDPANQSGTGGGTGGSTAQTTTDPVDALKTHADLDKYLADKGYTVQGWGETIKTVADKQTALRNADKAAAEAAAAGSGLV
jgi:hypothetical protein